MTDRVCYVADLQVALRDFDLVALGESDGLLSGQRAQQIWNLLLCILPRRNADLHNSSRSVLSDWVEFWIFEFESNSVTVICPKP